ncbi:MAG: 30S ribosomal protein S12 methylthiotransferase RimO, partial [Chthoniobacterales bacterium]
KNERYRRAMSLQQKIARETAAQNVGRDLRLLVDQPHTARTQADAPDVDTRVILGKAALAGEFITRRITGTRGYDLLA